MNNAGVSMPRRAYFVFHRGLESYSRQAPPCPLFQCPEGLILYFTRGTTLNVRI